MEEKELKKREDTLAAKAEKEQAKVNKIIDKIADLIDKRNNAYEIIENRTIDKAIGKKDLKFISDQDYNNAVKEGKNFTKAHLIKAASKCRKATTDTEREKYRKEFLNIYSYLLDNNSSEITNDLTKIAETLS